MDIIIREALPVDRPQLAAIFAECRRTDFSWLAADAMSLDDFNRAAEYERIYLAEQGGETLGFLSLWEPGCFIHFLFIRPRYQGNGIANRLVANLFPHFSRPYRLKCLDKNLRALQYYRREGWLEVGRGSDRDGDHRVLELVAPAR